MPLERVKNFVSTGTKNSQVLKSHDNPECKTFGFSEVTNIFLSFHFHLPRYIVNVTIQRGFHIVFLSGSLEGCCCCCWLV